MCILIQDKATSSFRFLAMSLFLILLACHSNKVDDLPKVEDDSSYRALVMAGDSLVVWGNPDSAQVMYARALQMADSLGHVRNQIRIAGVMGRIYLFELADVNKAEEILLRQEAWIDEHPGLEPELKVQSCLDLSSTYRRKYDLPHSEAYALTAYSMCNEKGVQDSLLRSRAFAAIGAYYHQILDSVEAKKFFHLARTNYPWSKEPKVGDLGWLVGLINVYNNVGQHDSALHYLHLYEGIGNHNPHILADANRLLSIFYFVNTQRHDVGRHHADVAIQFYRNHHVADPLNYAFTYLMKSAAQQNLKEYDLALHAIDSALLIYFGSVDRIEVFKKDINSIDWLASKAEILAAKGMHFKDTALLFQSLDLYRDIHLLMEHFTKWDTDGALHSRSYINFVYTKQVILFTFLYRMTENPVWLHQIHDILAAYKGFVFDRERKWAMLKQVPSHQGPIIRQILENDVQLQEALFESKRQPYDKGVKDFPAILSLYQTKEKLVRLLEANDTEAMASMRQPSRIPVDSVLQYTRANHTAIINYYIGDRYYNADSIYALVTHEGRFHLFVLSYDEPLTAAMQLLDTMHRRHTLGMDVRVDPPYVQASMYVYDRLLRPIRDALPDISTVIVLPDEALHLVALEGLITEVTKPLDDLVWGDPAIRYLVDQVSVSYAFTINRLHADPDLKRKYSIDVLGMAFTDMETLAKSNIPGLPELQGAIKDMQVLEDVFDESDLRLFAGFDCTKPNFFKNASKARVMHISTHGRVDPEQRHSGMLYMREGEGVGEIFQYELRFADIDPELLVLSACESGAGELVIDEGMMSIGRVFQANGAGKVISARWPVSDRASTDFFREFYSYYRKAGDADQSFRTAQLALRHTKSRFAFPGHWAGFAIFR